MRARLSIPPRAYTGVALAAQLILVIIVISGAGVRTSGSGLGCPDWPDCRGTFVPALDYHTWMEYGNRLLSAAVVVVCIAAGVLVFVRRPFRRDLVAPAMVLPVGVIAEGALGAGAVIFDLSWPVVIAHYLLSLALLLAATVLVWRARREPAAPRANGDLLTVVATRTIATVGGIVIVLGTFATAAGPHSGGAGTGDVVERLQALGPHTLSTLIHLHGHVAAGLGFAAIATWLLARWRAAPPGLRKALTALCLLLGAQGLIGLWQYYTNLPAGVVWLHSSMPAALWAVLIWSWLEAGHAVRAANRLPLGSGERERERTRSESPAIARSA